jgi:streptomycin 6-kinase
MDRASPGPASPGPAGLGHDTMRRVELELAAEMRRTAEAHGDLGQDWLTTLPGRLAAVRDTWGLTVDAVLPGGKAAYVATVRAADGTRAVLKLVPPWLDADRQARTIQAADGQGYVRLYGWDPTHDALLLEELGPMLTSVSASVEHVLDTLAGLLISAWRVPLATADPVDPGQDKASQLLRFIHEQWAPQGCPPAVRDRAIDYAQQRARAFTVDRCVVCHGDPHPNNALAVLAPRPGAADGFVFIDPDGFRCDRAYDLGVAMRGWPDSVLGALDPVGLVRGWAARLGAATGVDAEEIWQWSFVERVTSGLYLRLLGHEAEGRAYLAAAAALMR